MTTEENIRAILETVFCGFKEENIDCAVESIMRLPGVKNIQCFKWSQGNRNKGSQWVNFDPDIHIYVNGYGYINRVTGDILPLPGEVDMKRFKLYCEVKHLDPKTTAINSTNFNNMEEWYLRLGEEQKIFKEA